eukprot:1160017-Pelagomonas_calceolata.AAC.1
MEVCACISTGHVANRVFLSENRDDEGSQQLGNFEQSSGPVQLIPPLAPVKAEIYTAYLYRVGQPYSSPIPHAPLVSFPVFTHCPFCLAPAFLCFVSHFWPRLTFVPHERRGVIIIAQHLPTSSQPLFEQPL